MVLPYYTTRNDALLIFQCIDHSSVFKLCYVTQVNVVAACFRL
jgi:hypothetical protein